MKIKRNVPALLMALLISAPATGLACMSIPTPGSCTLQLGKKLQSNLKEQKQYIHQLKKRVRSENQLLVNEVSYLANRPGVRTNIDLIEDQKLKAAATAGTPIALAYRLEALRPKLSKKEWSEGVNLWADYIARSEDLWEPKSYEQYCDLQMEGKSLAVDAGYIFAWPFVLYQLNNGSEDPTKAIAASVTVGPLVTAAGVISLGADVLTFIPNIAAGGSKRLRTNVHLKLSSRAFRKFADYVMKQEKAHA